MASRTSPTPSGRPWAQALGEHADRIAAVEPAAVPARGGRVGANAVVRRVGRGGVVREVCRLLRPVEVVTVAAHEPEAAVAKGGDAELRPVMVPGVVCPAEQDQIRK